MTTFALPPLTRLPEGLDAVVHAWQGRWRRRRAHADGMLADARACLALCEGMSAIDERGLQARIADAREALRRDPREARGRLLEALATVGQVARRKLGKQPYAVQFMGALAVHRGWLAEMATGEGKTLTVGLAAVLAGWTGRPCHVLTSNDYLAVRDAEENAGLFTGCGVSVASVVGDHAPDQRRPAYQADVVYTTAKELLADHLRDLLAARDGKGGEQAQFQRWLGSTGGEPSAPVLQARGLHTAIVDEADSVLVDEAVTPLILAFPRQRPGLSEAILWARDLAAGFVAGEHFAVQPRTRSVELLAPAQALMERGAQQLHPIWRTPARREELVRNALTVRCFFLPGHQYLLHEGEIVLLDEFTGRMTPGRTLTAGLHQAIEAREGLALSDPNEAMVQMSFQAFFRRFRRLSGTTGTASEAARELWRIYQLAVLPIPTHRPRMTIECPLQVLPAVGVKWAAVVDEVRRVHVRGRPVLIGVRSVEASRQLSALLEQQGLAHRVLNAERHAEEAALVAEAGQPGRITIATNMAGRGTDIRLGEPAKQLGGLHVVIAECNESARVDRQLAGRCGRQGDPGSFARLLSFDDGLLRRFMPPWQLAAARALVPRLPATASRRLAGMLLRRAQRRAEADAYARRWSVLQNDDWMESALPFQPDGQ